MRNRVPGIFYSLSVVVVFFALSCTKSAAPTNLPGTWKLILTGGGSKTHRIDTFSMTRPNDSILSESLTFSSDGINGVLHLQGLGKDSGNVYSYMDSVYAFTWQYFGEGPEIWIRLVDNPRRRFHIWTDSANIHLHVNYSDNMYLCDYYPLIKGDTTVQEIFQRQN